MSVKQEKKWGYRDSLKYIIHSTETTEMKLQFRRAEPGDLPELKEIIAKGSAVGLEKALKRRFGDECSLEGLINASPISLVGTIETPQKTQQVVGLLCLSNGPSKAFNYDPSGEFKTWTRSEPSGLFPAIPDWEKWVKGVFETREDFGAENAKFVSYFLAESEFSQTFLESGLVTLFNWLPNLRYIGCLLPDNLVLYPPFSLTKMSGTEDASSGSSPESAGLPSPLLLPSPTTVSGQSANENGYRKRGRRHLKKGLKYFNEERVLKRGIPFTLSVAARRDFVPSFKIRKSRVEDCDDLMPMLKRQNLFSGSKSEYFLAELLESDSEVTKTLVAECDGEVVGFISFSLMINQKRLEKIFDLDAYSNLNPADAEKVEGAPATHNTFCISLFSIDDKFASQSFDLVRTAFQVLPDYEYCILTTEPTGQDHPLWRHFTQIRPREGQTAPHVLYLTNRYAENVRVRNGTVQDFDELVAGVVAESATRQDLLQALTNANDHSVYVVYQGTQTVGCALLSKCTDSRDLVDQFDIQDFVSVGVNDFQGRQVILKRLILNPLFDTQARWVLEEVLRIANIDCILFPNENSDQDTINVTTREFIPVKRRRQISYPKGLRDGSPIPEMLPHNLMLFTSAYLYQPKITVNTRIVFIGGSDASISAIERLIYTPHLHFTNLSLVTNESFPPKDEEGYIVKHSCYSDKDLKQVGPDHFVRIIRGSVEKIVREKRKVQLKDGSLVQYDYMVIAGGIQFHASAIHKNFEALKGVMSLNRGSLGELKLAAKNMTNEAEDEDKIIVYGKSLQAHAGVEMLLQEGVHPRNILFVNPEMRTALNCFRNEAVHKKVYNELDALEVKVMTGYRVIRWGEQPTSEGAAIKALVLEKLDDSSLIKVENVKYFIYADEKSVNHDSFKAINDACLVFDGRLVIDKYFRTQDPRIFGAGSITKYSSIYQTHWNQSHNDSAEVGVALSEIMLPLFDPIASPQDLNNSNTVLNFTECKRIEAKLPGGISYFHFDAPRISNMSNESTQGSPNYGRDLVLDSEAKGYIRFNVSPQGYVRSFTFLGKSAIPFSNFSCLFGIHERYLNRLVARFDEGVIPDFASFLSETWALPIYHDRFRSFIADFKRDLVKQIDADSPELTLKVKDFINEERLNNAFTPEEKVRLYRSFDESRTRSIWDERVFAYLQTTGIFDTNP